MKIATWTVILDDEYYIDLALRSSAPHVQGMYIQDQGCTDNSIEVIKETMKDYPDTPYVIESEFTHLPKYKSVEYEFRAKAVKRCEEIFKPDWLLLLDADEFFTEEFFELLNTVDLKGYNGVFSSCERFITPEYKDACFQSSIWINDKGWKTKEKGNGKRYTDPHCRFWRSGLGIKHVQNPGSGGFLHCMLSPEPEPMYIAPSEGTYLCHLHRSFGPKAFEFWSEGGDIFEWKTPFNPRRQAPIWWSNEINLPSAEKSNFRWPEYVMKKWREWGNYD